MIGNSNQGAFGRALEQLIFGNRMLVLALFALVTAVMLFFAAQLRVDAGFKKQIPLDHEFMKTFQPRARGGDGQERQHVQQELHANHGEGHQ